MHDGFVIAGDSQDTDLVQQLLHSPRDVLQQLLSLLDAHGRESSVPDAQAYYEMVSTRIQSAVEATLSSQAGHPVGSLETVGPGLRDVFLLGVTSLLVFTQYNLTGSVVGLRFGCLPSKLHMRVCHSQHVPASDRHACGCAHS